jgi:four helix bundle protein
MLIAYQVALDVIRKLRPLVEQIKKYDSHLADQLQRAATNTVANLAEGQRRKAGNKRRAYETAHGEAREVLGCLDCALAWGWIVDDGAAPPSSIVCSRCAGAHALPRASRDPDGLVTERERLARPSP